MFSVVVVFLAFASITHAFRPAITSGRSTLAMSFDLDKALNTLSSNKILTKTSQLGLLTRLEKAGFTLKTAVPLLIKADELDVLGILESSSDKVLPLVAQGIEVAPALLPLAATALNTPPSTYYAGAAASLLVAVGIVNAIPDDSSAAIALQTALAVPLGAILPGALGVGGFIVSKLK